MPDTAPPTRRLPTTAPARHDPWHDGPQAGRDGTAARMARQFIQRLALLLALGLGLSLAPLPGAGPAQAEAKRFATLGGVALGGHDPVAYASEGAAVPGNPEHALKWHGVIWYFRDAASLARFEMSPAAFAPALGGWCPVALAQGRMVPGDPAVFLFHKGRLYLMQTEQQRQILLQDPAGVIAAAQARWKAIPRK